MMMWYYGKTNNRKWRAVNAREMYGRVTVVRSRVQMHACMAQVLAAAEKKEAANKKLPGLPNGRIILCRRANLMPRAPNVHM
eukprot:scaffold34630_cov185-Amphora_coffeaeformis.AAC.14